jgi:hypothetical protein
MGTNFGNNEYLYFFTPTGSYLDMSFHDSGHFRDCPYSETSFASRFLIHMNMKKQQECIFPQSKDF